MYRAVDAMFVRAATTSLSALIPPWPDLTVENPAGAVPAWRDWLATVASTSLMDAIANASPHLACAIDRVRASGVDDPTRVRKVVLSVLRYLLRATGRATPFGLFAGIAPARSGQIASATWHAQQRRAGRLDSVGLSAIVDELETHPEVLAGLTVVANNTGCTRDGHAVVANRLDPAAEDSVVDVRVRITAPVAAALDHARTPVAAADLAAKLAAQWPDTPRDRVEAMLAGLVQERLLVTSLRPPMTCPDPPGHTLRLTGDVGAAALCNVRATDVDMRIDLDVVVPGVVVREAQAAARALTLLTPYPAGVPAWVQWHTDFLERYGPEALVPLADVLDPGLGLGLPATYRGSRRQVDDAGRPSRDQHLAILVQDCLVKGTEEVVLDEGVLETLSGGAALGQAPAHVALHAQVHATDAESIQKGRFRLAVTGGMRAAGASEGRFLRLLDSDELERLRTVYAGLPTARRGALPVQLSCPPLRRRDEGLARAPLMLPALLPVGEHPDPCVGDVPTVPLDDLAVGADLQGPYLVWLSRRRLVEPTQLNAMELRYHSHPLARLLCEITRARAAVYQPFTWGLLSGLRYLPRLRHGRSVLAPARWRLSTRDLPRRDAPWPVWQAGLAGWQQAWHAPRLVHLAQTDNLLRLDLAEPAHQAVLRAHLDRHGDARLDEAPPIDAFGWTSGHVHEIVFPLALAADALPGPDLAGPARPRVVARDDDHLPGTSPWLYARVDADPQHQWTLLDQFAEVVSGWTQSAGWWFLPYPEPRPHLRLRLRLVDAATFGDAAGRIGAWAAEARDQGLLGNLVLDTYQPETGRFGHGDAMAAAETVFIADSAAARAQHRVATRAALPEIAVTVASIIDIAVSYTGDVADGLRWLVQHLPHDPVRLDGTLMAAVGLVTGCGDPPPALLGAGSALTAAWQRRREALAAYRGRLAVQRDPGRALASLLHLHYVRVHGIDPEGERLARHLARTVALSRSRSSPDTP